MIWAEILFSEPRLHKTYITEDFLTLSFLPFCALGVTDV